MISLVKSMSYIMSLIIVTTMILLFSCDINDVLKDEDEKEEVQNTIEVGPNGGTVKVDDITISIPSGAFAEATNIKISFVPNTSEDEDIITNTYSVEGIPDQFSKPIDISIKHNGSISEQSFLIVQEDSYTPSLGSISSSNNYFEAVLSGDSIKVQIPERLGSLAKVASLVDIQNNSVWKILGISSRKNHTTTNNHFNIIYNTKKDNVYDIIALGQYLEDAYTKLEAIGFSYARRTLWPVQVYIENIASNVYGLHCPSRWGLNSYYLRFNRVNLNKQVEIKTTAIHEFFHLVQYLYDNRNVLSRATFQPEQHWFNEACAVWSEELVTNSGYISDVRTSNTLPKPFAGLHAGSNGDATNHGYGMSSFVKNIVKKYGEDMLVNVYNKIFAGRHVVDAINNSMNHNLFMDYNTFLQQYAQGQIYTDISHDILANNRDDTFRILSGTDTLKTFVDNYKDLSAKLYLVTLEYQSFEDDASLEITIDQNLCDITVFQYPKTGGVVSILAKGQKSCAVSDLKGLQKEKRLIVMITNSNYKSNNYSPSSKDINLKLEVKAGQEVLKFTKVCFDWALETNWSMHPSDHYSWQEWGFCFSPIVLELTKSGNTYSGSFVGHSGWNPGSAYSGSITFTLRDDENIVTLNGETNIASSVEFTFKNTRDGTLMWYDYIITMTDVEYNIKNNGDFGFYIGGIETCDHITFETNDVDSFGTLTYVVDYSCQADSRVAISFNND